MTPVNQFTLPVTPWQKVLRHGLKSFDLQAFAEQHNFDPAELQLEIASGYFQNREIIAAIATSTFYSVTALQDLNEIYFKTLKGIKQKTPESS